LPARNMQRGCCRRRKPLAPTDASLDRKGPLPSGGGLFRVRFAG
jgi:hypothetical protein